jgi:hypothetical protein
MFSMWCHAIAIMAIKEVLTRFWKVKNHAIRLQHVDETFDAHGAQAV